MFTALTIILAIGALCAFAKLIQYLFGGADNAV